MERVFDLVIAWLCAAVSWPVIGFKDTEKRDGWLPAPPDQAKLDAETGSWFHLKKDLWVNSVRADAEWWGKFLAMVILILLVVVIIQALVIAKRKMEGGNGR